MTADVSGANRRLQMKRITRIAVGIAASAGMGLAIATALAQTSGTPGMMHMHGMHGMHGMRHGAEAGGHAPMAGAIAMLTRQDAGSSADMGLVHELLVNHRKITRKVTTLPDGIETATESDDPQVARTIQAHVASMSSRLSDGREFNIFSTTLPVLFENREKIRSVVTMTERGAIVRRTSTDSVVVAALQGHATEVTELVQDGMAAMRRGMMTRMAMGMGNRGAPPAPAPSRAPGDRAPTTSGHAH
jgi:hypothetical protein